MFGATDWALKRFLQYVLKRSIGRYLQSDIDLQQLEIELGAGTLELRHVVVNCEELNKDLVVHGWVIKSGCISSIKVRLPLSTFGLGSCSVDVEEISLVLSPCLNQDAAHVSRPGVQQPVEEPSPPLDEWGLGQLGIADGMRRIAGGLQSLLKHLKVTASNVTVQVEVPAALPTTSTSTSQQGSGTQAVLLLHLDYLQYADRTPSPASATGIMPAALSAMSGQQCDLVKALELRGLTVELFEASVSSNDTAFQAIDPNPSSLGDSSCSWHSATDFGSVSVGDLGSLSASKLDSGIAAPSLLLCGNSLRHGVTVSAVVRLGQAADGRAAAAGDSGGPTNGGMSCRATAPIISVEVELSAFRVQLLPSHVPCVAIIVRCMQARAASLAAAAAQQAAAAQRSQQNAMVASSGWGAKSFLEELLQPDCQGLVLHTLEPYVQQQQRGHGLGVDSVGGREAAAEARIVPSACSLDEFHDAESVSGSYMHPNGGAGFGFDISSFASPFTSAAPALYSANPPPTYKIRAFAVEASFALCYGMAAAASPISASIASLPLLQPRLPPRLVVDCYEVELSADVGASSCCDVGLRLHHIQAAEHLPQRAARGSADSGGAASAAAEAAAIRVFSHVPESLPYGMAAFRAVPFSTASLAAAPVTPPMPHSGSKPGLAEQVWPVLHCSRHQRDGSISSLALRCTSATQQGGTSGGACGSPCDVSLTLLPVTCWLTAGLMQRVADTLTPWATALHSPTEAGGLKARQASGGTKGATTSTVHGQQASFRAHHVNGSTPSVAAALGMEVHLIVPHVCIVLMAEDATCGPGPAAGTGAACVSTSSYQFATVDIMSCRDSPAAAVQRALHAGAQLRRAPNHTQPAAGCAGSDMAQQPPFRPLVRFITGQTPSSPTLRDVAHSPSEAIVECGAAEVQVHLLSGGLTSGSRGATKGGAASRASRSAPHPSERLRCSCILSLIPAPTNAVPTSTSAVSSSAARQAAAQNNGSVFAGGALCWASGSPLPGGLSAGGAEGAPVSGHGIKLTVHQNSCAARETDLADRAWQVAAASSQNQWVATEEGNTGSGVLEGVPEDEALVVDLQERCLRSSQVLLHVSAPHAVSHLDREDLDALVTMIRSWAGATAAATPAPSSAALPQAQRPQLPPRQTSVLLDVSLHCSLQDTVAGFTGPNHDSLGGQPGGGDGSAAERVHVGPIRFNTFDVGLEELSVFAVSGLGSVAGCSALTVKARGLSLVGRAARSSASEAASPFSPERNGTNAPAQTCCLLYCPMASSTKSNLEPCVRFLQVVRPSAAPHAAPAGQRTQHLPVPARADGASNLPQDATCSANRANPQAPASCPPQPSCQGYGITADGRSARPDGHDSHERQAWAGHKATTGSPDGGQPSASPLNADLAGDAAPSQALHSILIRGMTVSSDHGYMSMEWLASLGSLVRGLGTGPSAPAQQGAAASADQVTSMPGCQHHLAVNLEDLAFRHEPLPYPLATAPASLSPAASLQPAIGSATPRPATSCVSSGTGGATAVPPVPEQPLPSHSSATPISPVALALFVEAVHFRVDVPHTGISTLPPAATGVSTSLPPAAEADGPSTGQSGSNGGEGGECHSIVLHSLGLHVAHALNRGTTWGATHCRRITRAELATAGYLCVLKETSLRLTLRPAGPPSPGPPGGATSSAGGAGPWELEVLNDQLLGTLTHESSALVAQLGLQLSALVAADAAAAAAAQSKHGTHSSGELSGQALDLYSAGSTGSGSLGDNGVNGAGMASASAAPARVLLDDIREDMFRGHARPVLHLTSPPAGAAAPYGACHVPTAGGAGGSAAPSAASAAKGPTGLTSSIFVAGGWYDGAPQPHAPIQSIATAALIPSNLPGSIALTAEDVSASRPEDATRCKAGSVAGRSQCSEMCSHDLGPREAVTRTRTPTDGPGSTSEDSDGDSQACADMALAASRLLVERFAVDGSALDEAPACIVIDDFYLRPSRAADGDGSASAEDEPSCLEEDESFLVLSRSCTSHAIGGSPGQQRHASTRASSSNGSVAGGGSSSRGHPNSSSRGYSSSRSSRQVSTEVEPSGQWYFAEAVGSKQHGDTQRFTLDLREDYVHVPSVTRNGHRPHSAAAASAQHRSAAALAHTRPPASTHHINGHTSQHATANGRAPSTTATGVQVAQRLVSDGAVLSGPALRPAIAQPAMRPGVSSSGMEQDTAGDSKPNDTCPLPSPTGSASNANGACGSAVSRIIIKGLNGLVVLQTPKMAGQSAEGRVEVEVEGLSLQIDTFSPMSTTSRCIKLAVHTLEVRDCSVPPPQRTALTHITQQQQQAQWLGLGATAAGLLGRATGSCGAGAAGGGSSWNRIVSYRPSPHHPRDTRMPMLSVHMVSVRPDLVSDPALEEFRLLVCLLPLRIKLDQRVLTFLQAYGQSVSCKLAPVMKALATLCVDPPIIPYFQKIEIRATSVMLDYRPRFVDIASLRDGNFAELINLCPLGGVEVNLKGVSLAGLQGWDGVGCALVQHWLTDISRTQMHKFLVGLAPIHSVCKVGSAVLALLMGSSGPLGSRHLASGSTSRTARMVRRCTIQFVRALMLEALGLSTAVASGAQQMSSRSLSENVRHTSEHVRAQAAAGIKSSRWLRALKKMYLQSHGSVASPDCGAATSSAGRSAAPLSLRFEDSAVSVSVADAHTKQE